MRKSVTRRTVRLLPTLVLVSAAVFSAADFESIDVAQVWAGHPVGFALATEANHQYVAFYDPERRMTVGQRRLGSTNWVFKTLPSQVKWDSHNSVVLAVDCQGHVHVSGNMHGSRLVYFRTTKPHDISDFERLRMVGSLEKKVTYPQFLKGGDGCLYFQYRHGKSGSGMRIMNRYDADSRSWSRLLSGPLFDGEQRMSAYLSGPVLGPDGYFHLVWMWRDTPAGSTNHDISYARSLDLAHWESVRGEPLRLPLSPRTSRALVDPVPSGGGLVAIGFGVGWDGRDRPTVSYSKYDEEGKSQWFNARWQDEAWRVHQTSDWNYRWQLDLTGALPWEITASPVNVDSEGRLTQSFTHLEEGRGVWVLDEESLQPTEVLPEPDDFRELRQVESSFPGMEVREFIFDAQGEYFLRWETLPINRDRPRKPPFPPPSKLRVFRREKPRAERLGDLPGTLEREAAGSEPTPAPTVGGPPEQDPSVPEEETLESSEARIGEVIIRIADVFDERDPSEDKKLFRLVNRLHPKTRDWVIRQQLFFRPGELYSARILEETERHLRARNYIYDAEIRPVRYEDGEVDVLVETRDVWTLNGGVRFSRAGGENDVEFKLKDSNFLGLGREVGLSHSKDFERTSSEFEYLDKNLLGSHTELEVKLADNSDGDRQVLKMRRPFYALDVRRALGMTVLMEDRVDFFFDRGEIANRFRHTIDFFEAYWGISGGLREGSVTRWKLGYSYSDDSFFRSPGQSDDFVLPPDRKLSWPWIQMEFVQDRFVEARDLNRISRTEDINLGTTLEARAGLSSPTFGADETLTILSFVTASGFRPTEQTLLFTSASGGTRYGDGDFRTVVLGASARLFWRNFDRHAFFAQVEANFVEDLDAEKQLLLGGDTGLRGYPLGYQNGDRRFLVTLEQRFFTRFELLKLGHLGGAIFFDAGRAWFNNGGPGEDLGVLKDVGVGLRLASSRSSGKSMVHVDIAYPLDGDDSIDSLQFLVTTKESF